MLELDKKTNAILKECYKKTKIDSKSKFFNNNNIKSFNFLIDNDLITSICEFVNTDTVIYPKTIGYEITVKGRAFFENKRNERLKHWIPIIISNTLSIIAIIVSIIALMR